MSAALEVGDVVISKAGHDRGNLFVVLESIDSEYVRIADGRTRTLEKPKKKKRRHLKAVAEAERTAKVSWQNNAEIRTFLKQYQQNRN
ncbi:MAG: KOW domain-containing RNA-binding protein [Clostridia bacterium]|jgi:ribosomal protein L14E/L6E/L27E|nr:KOW domain-containing RNA-binding protein [Clostridia bacterium]